MSKTYQICTQCVMDTSDPDIVFDNAGVCNHCLQYNTTRKLKWLPNADGQKILLETIDKIKRQNKHQNYDCIVGLSGGVDSSYLLYLVKEKYGLRPLAFHMDAGWNSDEAISNIQNLVTRLDIDLYTEVLNWAEMQDLQRAFLKSGLANQDAPQDHAIFSSLYHYAEKNNISWVISGSNIASESILPQSWGYDAMDWTLIKDVHHRFGTRKLKTFPHLTWFKRFIYYPYISGMKRLAPLNYIDYNKDEAKKYLIDHLGWKDYGGKHHESRFTKFFQTYYLPTKFGYDKRRAHYSSMIVANHTKREEALQKLEEPPYGANIRNDKEFFAKKLGFSIDELDALIAAPSKNYTNYKNSAALTENCRKLAAFLKRVIKK